MTKDTTAETSPSPAASTRQTVDKAAAAEAREAAGKGQVALVVNPHIFPTKRVVLDGVEYDRTTPVVGDEALLERKDPRGRQYLVKA